VVRNLARVAWVLGAVVASPSGPSRAIAAENETSSLGDLAPLRAACEQALAREDRGEPGVSSRLPCHAAMLKRALPQDLRNEVASLLSPAARPSLDDLALASLTADAALRAAVDQPWGYLARCDIARRLGSADVMEACLADLRRVARTSPETQAALARIGAQRPLWASAVGILIALGFLGTLVHRLLSLGRTRTRSPSVRAKSVVLTMIALSSAGGVAFAGTARAEARPSADKGLSKLKVDDANPEASIPSAEQQAREPLQFGYLLQDLTDRADRAITAGDHRAAARYYRALTKATPSSFAPRMLCQELQATGDSLNAVVACRTAITRQGTTAGDFVRFVRLVLAQKGPLPANERAELETQIDHLAAELQQGRTKLDDEDAASVVGAPSIPTLVPALRCEVAIRVHDVPALEACTGVLSTLAPDETQTVSFEWALALERHDRGAALRLIDRARGLGMSADGLTRMERATSAMYRRWLGRVVLVVALAGLAATLVTYALRRSAGRRRVPA
jgi:hypothetical protein